MSIDELVNIHYDKLNQNDIHIWKYIHSNKRECCSLSIDELAKKCNVSRTTILRFAQKLSLKGYSELKVYLNWELSNDKSREVNIEEAFKAYEKAIVDIKNKDFRKACRMINKANRVFIYGTGLVQMSVSEELKRVFLSAQKYFYIIGGKNEMSILLNTIQPDDLVIFVSMSGQSKEVTAFAKTLKVINVPCISITRLMENELARMCDENLYITTANIDIGNGIKYETTTLFFVLIEILFLRYCVYYPSN